MLRYEATSQQGTMIVTLKGELDHHAAAVLKSQLDEGIDRENIRDLTFDMQGLNFMDSSGIGLILGRYKKIKEAGGMVRVRNASVQAMKILELSGLRRIIPLIQERGEAL